MKSGGTVESLPEISIVLATLNEGRNIREVVQRIERQKLPSYEIIVVDDGSTDGTREYVRERSTQDSRIRYLFHDGKQTTLRAHGLGIDATRGRFVVVMDADLQHPPETIPSLVHELELGASVVVASRYAKGGSAGPRTLVRFAYSRGAEWIAKALLVPARQVRDPISGYFGFRRTVWVPLNPQYRGYKILLFVLVMAEGQRTAEVGFGFEPRTEGTSKATQSLAFIRLFLIEVLLARRLRRLLKTHPGGGASSFPRNSAE
jgi:dolichol-phosphate mannosyltransferase